MAFEWSGMILQVVGLRTALFATGGQWQSGGLGHLNSRSERSLMSEVRSPGRLRSRTSEKGGELVYLEDHPT